MNEQIKRKRGRPAGSVSLTNITLAELMEKYKPDQVLPVGRLFLEKGKLTSQQIKTKVGEEIQKRMADASVPSVDSSVEMTLQA